MEPSSEALLSFIGHPIAGVMEDSPGAWPGRSETTGNAGRIPDDADQLSSAEPIFATQSSGKSGATFAHWEPKPEAERLPEDATYSSSTPRASRFVTALLPLPFIRLGLLAVSMLARFIVHKFRFGMPSAAEACYTPMHRARMKLHGSLE